MKKLTLHYKHCPTWLLVLLVFLFLLRIPSFFEPYSYVDETIYLAIGTGVRQGLILYRDLFDHKTPLIYFLAAVADGNQFWFKVIFNTWMLLTVVLFYKFVTKLFENTPRVAQISTIIFGALTTLRLFEGMVIESEGLMIGPTILGFYLLYSKKNEQINILKLALAGSLLSLATHLKVPAIFDVAAILFLLLITQNFRRFLVKLFWVLVGFLIPTLFFVIVFWFQGALGDYIETAILFNFGYITAFRPGDAEKSFIERNMPLLIRGGLSAVGFIILWLARKKISKPFLFTSLWLITSLFAVTLSERPYPHYLVQILPSISILLGILFASPKYEQALSVIPLFVGFLVPVLLGTWHYKSVDYYFRFMQFASGKINKQAYFDAYDNKVNRNYEIAKYIRERTDTDDKVFVWGDAPPIYALSKSLPPTKYVTSFHINDLPERKIIIDDLESNLPVFIVVTPDSSDFDELNELIEKHYILFETIGNAKVYKIDRVSAKLESQF